MNEIFIHIKGIGFTFLLDKKMKHNLIGPAFLAFFNLRKRQMYSLSDNNIREVNTKPVYDNLQPFLPDYVDSISIIIYIPLCGEESGKMQGQQVERMQGVQDWV